MRKKQVRRPTAVDLFCGCGGMTLGLTQAGFDVIGAVDIDPLSIETYKKNHEGVKVWEMDIRRLKATTVKSQLNLIRGQLDLLAACPPCQGFSTMRTLNSGTNVSDSRNSLVFTFLAYVRILLPKAVMLENVPGLGKDWRFTKLRTELKKLGYHCDFDILNAANYGVPQRRRRLIMIGVYGADVELAKPLKSHKTVRTTIGKLPKPGAARDPLHKSEANRTARITDLIRHIPKDGGSRGALGTNKQLACHRRCDGFKDVYGRMAWQSVAPTITSGCINPSKGRFLHPSANRAITLREAAMLQSFPRKYKFSLARGKYATAAMIGNALPPQFVKMHAIKLRKALSGSSFPSPTK
jgi:DNA (cytosine-5)-methyltransferase 1